MARRPSTGDELTLADDIKSAKQIAASHRHTAPLVPVGNSLVDPFCDKLLSDTVYQRELAMLRAAARTHMRPGIDIRDVLPGPVTHDVLLAWQKTGEARLAEEKGRDDLINKRRHFILRTDDGMPLDPPLIHSVPVDPADSREYRMYVLRDEKEYQPIGFYHIKHPATDLRPIL